MSKIIAMAGKGGTGKTTIAGLVIRYLLEKDKKPVLAVDGDANANLNEVLGVEVRTTLGEAREGLKGDVPTGMTRDVYMEMKVEQALVEGDGFDLIVMGRPEGAGCYCHANTLLSKYVDRLCNNYRVVVMDNEAGMEHISRLVARRADILFIVTDPTKRGIQAAIRIRDLVRELNLDVNKAFVIVNRVRNGLPEAISADLKREGLELAGVVSDDARISQFDEQGRPTFALPPDSPAVQTLWRVFDDVLGDF